MSFKWNLNGHRNSPGEIKCARDGSGISDRGSCKCKGTEMGMGTSVLSNGEAGACATYQSGKI